MKKLFFIIFIFFLRISLFAQTIVVKKNEDFLLSYDDGSLVIKNTGFTEEGYTSIPEKNCKVALKGKDGKMYNHVYGRIDLLTGKFIYTINAKDFICTVPLEQIKFDSCNTVLNGAVFKTGFPSVDHQTEKTFYQLLADGKAIFLKYYQINWHDEMPYNSTNITRIYKQSVKYYLYIHNRMYKVEKNYRNLPKMLAIPDGYLSKNKFKLIKEGDAIQLIAYYNSL